MPQVSKIEYTCVLMIKWAMAQMVAGPQLVGMVWVWDDTQSSTAKSHTLNRVQVACL